MAQPPPPPPPPPPQPQISSLPDYSPDDDWLQLSLRIITASGNTSNTAKFLALYRALPKDVAKDYKALLVSNAATTYNDLVQELTARFQMPDHAKFQTLHTLESIGDRSPKQFLRDLRSKYQAAGGINNANLRYAFALGLPVEFRNLVFAADPNNLTDAAARVDDLWNANKSLTPQFNPYGQPQIMSSLPKPNSRTSVDNNQHSPAHLELENLRLNSALDEATDMIKKLGKRLDDLEASNANTSRSFESFNRRPDQRNQNFKFNRPSQPKCPKPPTAEDPQGLCFYHYSFGSKARKCGKEDCSWPNFKIPMHNCGHGPCPWDRFFLQNSKN